MTIQRVGLSNTWCTYLYYLLPTISIFNFHSIFKPKILANHEFLTINNENSGLFLSSWVVSGYRDGHGPVWKAWAKKVMDQFPELPIIARCHAYSIRTKFNYRCTKCHYQVCVLQSLKEGNCQVSRKTSINLCNNVYSVWFYIRSILN